MKKVSVAILIAAVVIAILVISFYPLGRRQPMNKYADVNAFLIANEKEPSNRTQLSDERIARLREENPGIPEDYLDYLKLVGWGSFRESQYMIYEGPIPLIKLIDGSRREGFKATTLAFGDDFSGYFGCFLADENWVIAESFHGAPLTRFDGSFEDFMRKRMQLDP